MGDIVLYRYADANAPPAGEPETTAFQAGQSFALKKILPETGANVNAPSVGDGGRTALQAMASGRHDIASDMEPLLRAIERCVAKKALETLHGTRVWSF